MAPHCLAVPVYATWRAKIMPDPGRRFKTLISITSVRYEMVMPAWTGWSHWSSRKPGDTLSRATAPPRAPLVVFATPNAEEEPHPDTGGFASPDAQSLHQRPWLFGWLTL
jgi:hypothetical protein